MAKARATCMCATCGETFEVTAYKSNSREARRFEEWAVKNITECDECAHKRRASERAEENARAALEAAENGWPVLTGSEKQVAWATTIRSQQIMEMAKAVMADRASLFAECVDEFLAQKTSAAWWIDNQVGGYVRERLREMMKEALEHPERRQAKEEAKAAAEEAEADAATIAEPNERRHDGIVDIRASEQRVTASYRKDDDFRTLVKSLGYRWDSAYEVWYITIGLKTGTAHERAAELGNRLLNDGFAIRIQDAETLKDAVEGNYQPMTRRWVSVMGKKFFITWARDDSFYDRARKLPGARYSSPGIEVPDKEFESVLDFANTYGFKLTPGAQQLADKMRAAVCAVNPAPAKTAKYYEHPLSEVLESSRDVLEDLKDGPIA